MTQGAETTLYAALSPELKGHNGEYLEDCAFKEPSKISQDENIQDRLWETTKGLLEPWLTKSDLRDYNGVV
jgi:dehydrogenase/reductase SDR family protein X